VQLDAQVANLIEPLRLTAEQLTLGSFDVDLHQIHLIDVGAPEQGGDGDALHDLPSTLRQDLQ
jgi:hypothetical protein